MSERAPSPSNESDNDIGLAARAMSGEFSDGTEVIQDSNAEGEAEMGGEQQDNPDSAPETAEAAVDTASQQEVVPPNRTLERPEDILELTPEEERAKNLLHAMPNLHTAVRERANPRVNSAQEKLDAIRDKRDIALKKGLLLEYREGAKQRKSNRLEAAALRARPGSMRQRRLSRKLGKTNRKLRETSARIARIDSAHDMRDKHRENVERLRRREIQRRRDIIMAEKKVAVEKKNRRKVMNEMKETTNPAQKEWLKQEIAGWPSIGKFREGLLEEAMKNYKDPRRQSDYDLAA